MKSKSHFEQSYKSGDAPWDIGKPDFNLIQTVTATPIKACKALEIGCGTGDNAIWLSQQNFQVVGIDASQTAIKKAQEKALKANAPCTFFMGDVVTSRIEGAPFGFAFDRGCFHTLDSDKERRRFVKNVHAHLGESGLWLSLLGNADEQREGPGPPRRTAMDIVKAVEPCFEILSLVSGTLESNRLDTARAWVCLMQKRH